MTAPQGSFQTNFGRFYSHPKFALQRLRANSALASQGYDIDHISDDPYAPKPSITNIIGTLDKAFLPPWYAKLVAEYAISNLDNLQRMVDRFGPEVAIGSLKAIPSQPNPAAAVGDEVHAAIDVYAKGRIAGFSREPAEIPPFSTTTAAHMFAQFLNFIDQAQPEIVRSEYTVWSYEHGYAGTGDLMWRWQGGLWIVDTKSGKNVHPEVGMQTVAISKADVILDAKGNEHPMPPVDELGVMHVRPRSVKLHRLERREECFKAFLGLKAAFDWMRFDADLVIQGPTVYQRIKDAA